MWPANPDQTMLYIGQRQATLRAEASNERLVRRSGARSHTYRVNGRMLQIGSLLIVVGRRLCDEDARVLHPAH